MVALTPDDRALLAVFGRKWRLCVECGTPLGRRKDALYCGKRCGWRVRRGLWSGGAGVVPFRPLELRLAGGPMTQPTSQKARFAKRGPAASPGADSLTGAGSKTRQRKTARSGPSQIQNGTLYPSRWTARLGLRNLGHRLPYRLPQKGLQGILLPGHGAPTCLSCPPIKHRSLHIILTRPRALLAPAVVV
jgi:ribosomal protein S27AE